VNDRCFVLDGHEPKPEHDLIVWATWFETADRSVAWTAQDDIVISTVFLGLDHRFGDGPPQLFETMVFGGLEDRELDRYATWDEAIEGHRAMVRKIFAPRQIVSGDVTSWD